LVKDEYENEYVQQSKEIEKCAYDSSEENEEGFESSERTFPLCFASFELLKKNVYNVSNKKSSRHDVEYEESSGLANENCLPLCFSSFELLKVNHEIIEEAVKSDYTVTLFYMRKLLSMKRTNNLLILLMTLLLITWKVVSVHICSL
jgi:hypothetical protein